MKRSWMNLDRLGPRFTPCKVCLDSDLLSAVSGKYAYCVVQGPPTRTATSPAKLQYFSSTTNQLSIHKLIDVSHLNEKKIRLLA